MPVACHAPAALHAPLAASTYAEEVRRVYNSAREAERTRLTWAELIEARLKLAAVEEIDADWNGGDSEAPNLTSRQRARRLVELAVRDAHLMPSAVLPSVEGGIAFVFKEGLRQGSIEILNSGELVAAYFDNFSEPTVWEFAPNDASTTTALERIRVFVSR